MQIIVKWYIILFYFGSYQKNMFYSEFHKWCIHKLLFYWSDEVLFWFHFYYYYWNIFSMVWNLWRFIVDYYYYYNDIPVPSFKPTRPFSNSHKLKSNYLIQLLWISFVFLILIYQFWIYISYNNYIKICFKYSRCQLWTFL